MGAFETSLAEGMAHPDRPHRFSQIRDGRWLCDGCEYVWPIGDPPAKYRAADPEEQAKQDGVDQAAGATPDWQFAAREWIDGQPMGATFTADDLCDAIGVPASQGAVGAAFVAASKRGTIGALNYVKSDRAGRHKSRIMKWRRIDPR